MKTTPAISATLKVLLDYAKTKEPQFTWRALAAVLAPMYYHDMSLVEVLQVLTGAYEEALLEARFELPSRNSAAESLILAPIRGHHAIDGLLSKVGPRSLETTYTVEQFYTAMIAHMLSGLRLSRVDWLLGDAAVAELPKGILEWQGPPLLGTSEQRS